MVNGSRTFGEGEYGAKLTIVIEFVADSVRELARIKTPQKGLIVEPPAEALFSRMDSLRKVEAQESNRCE